MSTTYSRTVCRHGFCAWVLKGFTEILTRHSNLWYALLTANAHWLSISITLHGFFSIRKMTLTGMNPNCHVVSSKTCFSLILCAREVLKNVICIKLNSMLNSRENCNFWRLMATYGHKIRVSTHLGPAYLRPLPVNTYLRLTILYTYSSCFQVYT